METEKEKGDENKDGDEDETQRDEGRKRKISRRGIKNVRHTLFTEHFFSVFQDFMKSDPFHKASSGLRFPLFLKVSSVSRSQLSFARSVLFRKASSAPYTLDSCSQCSFGKSFRFCEVNSISGQFSSF